MQEAGFLKRNNRLVSKDKQRWKGYGLSSSLVNQFITCWTLSSSVDWTKLKSWLSGAGLPTLDFLQAVFDIIWSSLGSLGPSLYSPIHPFIHTTAGTTTTLELWGLSCHTLQMTLCEIDPPSYVCSHTLFLTKSKMVSNLFSLHLPTNTTRI